MQEQALVNLLNKLGYRPENSNGEWLQVSCPLAHLHAKGRDSNPSCSISISNEDQSVVHCFVCGTRTLGSMLATMVYTHNLSQDLVKYYTDHEILREKETNSFEFQDRFALKSEKEIPVPVPDEVIGNFLPPNVVKKGITGNFLPFLEKRGIDHTKTSNIVYHSTKSVVVFLIKDLDQKTYWLHARSIINKSFWYLKPKDFGLSYEWGRSDSWYNIENIDWDEPLIVVEGEMDCERLKTLGVDNVIASHGPPGIKKLERLNRAKLVVLGFDADEAGKRFKDNSKSRLKCRTIELDWSKVGCKDAGELKSRKDFDKVWQSRTGVKNYTFNDKFRKEQLHAIL